MTIKKVGFFGGSFDPIHFGHLHLAIRLFEIHRLDEVLFCPAYLSPHKNAAPPVADAFHRLKMVELAIAPLSQLKTCEWEIENQTISYTIDTLRSLIQQNAISHKQVKYYLILGEDALTQFHHWKEVEKLVEIASPLVGSRSGGFSLSLNHLSTHLQRLISEGMTKIPILDISSTEIRERLKQGLFCADMVPAKVLDYIYQNHLYS